MDSRPPYRPAQLIGALDFVGVGSTFIVALVGLFTGMAFTVSVIVGFRQFSAEGMVGGVVALALARELAPVLAPSSSPRAPAAPWRASSGTCA